MGCCNSQKGNLLGSALISNELQGQTSPRGFINVVAPTEVSDDHMANIETYIKADSQKLFMPTNVHACFNHSMTSLRAGAGQNRQFQKKGQEMMGS